MTWASKPDASAWLKELQKKFGLEPELVVAAAKEQMGRKGISACSETTKWTRTATKI